MGPKPGATVLLSVCNTHYMKLILCQLLVYGSGDGEYHMWSRVGNLFLIWSTTTSGKKIATLSNIGFLFKRRAGVPINQEYSLIYM